jgi:hypothetical protein
MRSNYPDTVGQYDYSFKLMQRRIYDLAMRVGTIYKSVYREYQDKSTEYTAVVISSALGEQSSNLWIRLISLARLTVEMLSQLHQAPREGKNYASFQVKNQTYKVHHVQNVTISTIGKME